MVLCPQSLSALFFYQFTLFLVDLFIKIWPAPSVIPDPFCGEMHLCNSYAQENCFHSGTSDFLLLTYCGSEYLQESLSAIIYKEVVQSWQRATQTRRSPHCHEKFPAKKESMDLKETKFSSQS